VEVQTVAHQATVSAQAHLGELRNLLHQCGDSQRSVTSSVGHRANVPAGRVSAERRAALTDAGSVEIVASFESENFLVAADDSADLVEALLEVARQPGSWLNIEPDVQDSLRADVSGLFSWFSARGAQVPVGTLVAASPRNPASIGIDHGSGRGAGDRLAAAGIGSPSGWVLRQDHPKRGLVWESPTGPGNAQDAAAVASLFMEATELFCQLQVPGRWRVGIHTPKG
jgi:hypothetical protein